MCKKDLYIRNKINFTYILVTKYCHLSLSITSEQHNCGCAQKISRVKKRSTFLRRGVSHFSPFSGVCSIAWSTVLHI